MAYYHTAIATGAIANASTFNTPLGSIDTQLYSTQTDLDTLESEITGARGGYDSLDARLSNLVIAGGNIATLTNGAASAGQKVVDVDSTTGFIANAYVAYALNGGNVEYNTIGAVTSPTRLTLGTNIGTGGIANDTYIAMISTSEYQAANAINHGSTDLTLREAMIYAAGGMYNVKAYGAVGDGVADDTDAIQAAIAALEIEAYGSAYFAGTLLFPPGVYYVSDTLTIQGFRGFRMVGTGGASRLVWTANAPTKPVLDILDCRNSYVGDMHIECSGGSGAGALALIRIARTASDSPTPRFNKFANLFLTGGINNVIVGGSAYNDSNNDFMQFENVEFNNYTQCGLTFGGAYNSQAYNYFFLNCGFVSAAPYGIYGVGGNGFTFIGGGFGLHTTAAVCLSGANQPYEFGNFDEEGNAKFLIQTGNGCYVNIHDARLACNGVGVDKTMIEFGGIGSTLTIERCVFGDGISPTGALKVAKVAFGSDANNALFGRFIFNDNIVCTTLDGTTWDDWPFDSTGMLPTEAHGNLRVPDVTASARVPLDILNKAPTGAGLEAGYPFSTRVGYARVVRTSNGAYAFTTFANVPPYHIFTVICDHTNTFYDHSDGTYGDNLYLAGHTNWVATAGSSITFFHDYDNDRFIELSRSEH